MKHFRPKTKELWVFFTAKSSWFDWYEKIFPYIIYTKNMKITFFVFFMKKKHSWPFFEYPDIFCFWQFKLTKISNLVLYWWKVLKLLVFWRIFYKAFHKIHYLGEDQYIKWLIYTVEGGVNPCLGGAENYEQFIARKKHTQRDYKNLQNMNVHWENREKISGKIWKIQNVPKMFPYFSHCGRCRSTLHRMFRTTNKL